MAVSPSNVSSYAASDPGFAAIPVDELLAGESDLIARIKLCYGSDRLSFERDVLSLIRRYAAYVHLLPATADNYFSKPGGLLRLGLETAFFSLQGTDAHIFSGRMSISARRQLEPRWRHATFIAGLCCELHRLMSHLIVTDGAGETWPAYLQPLADWLTSRRSERYFLRWRPQAIESRGLGLFALPLVVPPGVMADLGEENTVIVPHLLASISGIPIYREHNILDELVRRSLALVIDRNLVASADRYGSPHYGSHLERYLVDALRRLSSGNSAWVPNREKSRLWFGEDGLFLVWPAAADDIHQLLEDDQLAGIPKAPETILELLLAAGVFEAVSESDSVWLIQPPGAKTPVEAVRFSSPAILLAGIDPPPMALPQALECQPKNASSQVVQQMPASVPPPFSVKSGTQLSLIAPTEPVTGNEVISSPGNKPPASEPAPTFVLQAPMRLNPLVRDVMIDAIRTLNEGMGPARVCTVAHGLFVPLEEFAGRGIQPSLAMRALAETKMLVTAKRNGPPTLSHEFNGQPTMGIVIDPRFVSGLDPASFSAPLAEED